MGVIQLRHSARITKPQGLTRVDWSNSITRGLVFAFDGAHWVDAVSGTPGIPRGTPAVRDGLGGRSTYFDGSSSLEFADNPAYRVTGDVSMLIGVTLTRTNGGQEILLSKRDNGSWAHCAIECYSLNTTPAWFRSNYAAYSQQIGAAIPNANVPHTVFWENVADATQTGLAGLDGATLASATVWDANTSVVESNSSPVTLGAAPYTLQAPLIGYINFAFVWNRRLSPGEYASVSANPWQLFEPDAFYLPIQTGGGSSTTTVTVDAGTLSLTGQSVTDTVTAAVGAGIVTLTGQSIGITITVPISPGTLSLTGSDVTVVPPSGSFSIAVDPGALSLTGQAVTNLVTTPISEGSTSLTGQDVSVTTTVTVDPGSITLTGEVITVSYLGTQTIPIEPGTLSVTGRDVEVSITGGTKGGVGKGKNLTLKQKKKLKAVVSQEWLKAEQTAKELLQERLGNVEPAKVRVERLTTVQSLADVIAALQALSKETVTLPEQQAVIKSFEKSIDTKVIKTGERLVAVEDKVNETLGRIEKKIQNLEDLLIVVIDELL